MQGVRFSKYFSFMFAHFLASSLLLGVTGSALQPAPGGKPRFGWDTLPVFFHSANASGDWSSSAAKQAARFAMATNEKDHAMPLPGGGKQSEEIAGPAACRQIGAEKTGVDTFFYLNSVIGKDHKHTPPHTTTAATTP
jgi:hypothetical protein